MGCGHIADRFAVDVCFGGASPRWRVKAHKEVHTTDAATGQEEILIGSISPRWSRADLARGRLS